MSYFLWSKRWVDDRKRDQIKSATLYYNHSNNVDYDGDDNNYNLIGGFYLTDDGSYRAHVGHSLRTAESGSPHYGEQQALDPLPNTFPDLLSAQNAILDIGYRYLLTLAETIRTTTI